MDKTYALERVKHGQTYVLKCVKHGQNICIREC